MRAWACSRCNQLHTQNPGECRECGHRIFRPVSVEELDQRSTESPSPESYEPDLTVSSHEQHKIETSPDVAPDGSIVDNSSSEDESAIGELLQRLRSWLF
jgi:predicted ATP-dependent serine protease